MLLPAPRPGDAVHIGSNANYRYAGRSAITMRVVKLRDEPAVAGLAWVHGYVLDRQGRAVAKRTVLVRIAGLIFAWAPEPGDQRADGDQTPVAPASNVTQGGVRLCTECYRWQVRGSADSL